MPNESGLRKDSKALNAFFGYKKLSVHSERRSETDRQSPDGGEASGPERFSPFRLSRSVNAASTALRSSGLSS